MKRKTLLLPIAAAWAALMPPGLSAAPLEKYQPPPSVSTPDYPPQRQEPRQSEKEPQLYREFRIFIQSLPTERLDELIGRYSRMRLKYAEEKKAESVRYYGDLIEILYREKAKR